MNINVSLIFIFLPVLLFILLIFSVFKLKKQTQADGASMMFYSLLAMLVFSILFTFFEIEVVWFTFVESGISALTLLAFCIGFYRFAKWLVYKQQHIKPRMNDE